MFCNKCGAELPEGSMTCPSCDATGGTVMMNSENETTVESAVVVSESAPAPKKKRKGVLIAILAVIAACVAVTLLCNEKEDAVVGRWEAVTVNIGDNSVPASTVGQPAVFHIKNDGTMKMALDGNEEDEDFDLVWEYAESTDKGTPFYNFKLPSIDIPLGFFMMGDDSLIIYLRGSSDMNMTFFCERR